MQTTATMPQETIINGVNVTQLKETIQAVRENPGLADFKFRAANQWVNGGYNQVRIQDYYGTQENHARTAPFMLEADEPPVLLGEDRGPNPVEYLLAALSGCMTTTLAYHAAARGIELESVESEYEGDIDLRGFLELDPNVRKGYQEIRVKFKIKSDAEEAKLLELMKKSPVYDVVSRGTPVKITIEKL